MRVSSPKTMSAILSAVASGASAAGMFILLNNQQNAQWIILVIVAVTFTLIYFISLFVISQFIFEKINPIYKTIQSLKLSRKDLKKNLEGKDILTEVNREVLHWSNSKSQEIDKLRDLEDYRKEFVGNVSHELKTPIFNIQGYVLTLLDGALNDPSINKKYLEQTEKSINRLISIVEDLESISNLESRILKLVMEKTNIVQLVNEVFEALEMRAKENHVRLVFDKDYETPIWVTADKKQIYQTLINLISNSINYGKEGGQTRVSFMDMGESILVEVNDDGIGISEENIPRVFERFFRVDKSRSREHGGTGLGLAIVKHIVEAHQQTINVRSKPNEGTSFVFTLAKHKPDKR
ncbi:MAG: ATP-binding protein [Bacteroidales bacterium]|nr:ATP-binding protein [Bacteroidales bacterium]MDD3892294.1 ATP-binding protein [Bacteroidales bacterium]